MEGEEGIRIHIVDVNTGEEIDQFIIPDTAYDTERVLYNTAMSLYATDDYIVVLSRLLELEKGQIQRFTYDGEFIDEAGNLKTTVQLFVVE